jgi:hypothetical protein
LYFHNASTDVYDGVERRDSTWIAHHEFWLKQFRSTAHEHGTEIAENILDALGGRPKFMLEVGSFLGTGAVNTWGPLRAPAGGIVLCVDTWLGDVIMRLGPQYQRDGAPLALAGSVGSRRVS